MYVQSTNKITNITSLNDALGVYITRDNTTSTIMFIRSRVPTNYHVFCL